MPARGISGGNRDSAVIVLEATTLNAANSGFCQANDVVKSQNCFWRWPTMPQSSSPLIFISYRREGGIFYADVLEEKLVAHFGKDKTFIDRGGIEIGEDFERKISDALSTCEVLLAIIGKTWLGNSK